MTYGWSWVRWRVPHRIGGPKSLPVHPDRHGRTTKVLQTHCGHHNATADSLQYQRVPRITLDDYGCFEQSGATNGQSQITTDHPGITMIWLWTRQGSLRITTDGAPKWSRPIHNSDVTGALRIKMEQWKHQYAYTYYPYIVEPGKWCTIAWESSGFWSSVV